MVPVDHPDGLFNDFDVNLHPYSESPGQEGSVVPTGHEWGRTPRSAPTFGGEGHPGATVPYDLSKYVPPPDFLGFYLPFHHFFPVWWGVYLVAEGVEYLARFIAHRTEGELEWEECVAAARVFIYGHESFHHAVECFATRLEVTHRKPLYRTGFRNLYRSASGTDHWMEEALAGAHGVRKVQSTLFRANKDKAYAARSALGDYLSRCPEGYRRAMDYFYDKPFLTARAEFAEECQVWALPHLPPKDPSVWNCFPHAFSGISRVNSRVNYVVRRDSALFTRINEQGYLLRYRDVEERLRQLAGCEQVRQNGSHVIWKKPDGGTFPVPRHPRDIAKGTLKKIISQAGLDLSVSQFVAAGA